MEPLTPEERLLRLIRKKGGKTSSGTPTEKAVPARSPLKKAKTPLLVLFKKANQILTVGVAILFGLGAVHFLWGKFRSETPLLPETTGTFSEETPKKEEAISRKPYNHYSSEIEKRNIFGPSLQAELETPSIDTQALREAFQNLILVGIISGKNPQAIIEDKKEGKTHFINVGDTIGQLQVEDIREDKVILNYRGERLDLAL